MSEQRIDLIKKVYSKTEYPKVIDTSFTELGVISVNQQIAATTTVNQFFQYYNELFYEIPAFGEVNSHEYLVKTSGEYINYDQDSALITALQNEISQLRRDLLTSQIDLAEALSGRKLNIDPNAIDDTTINSADQFNQILNGLGTPNTATNTSTLNSSLATGADPTQTGNIY
jgi:hypothetical protein